MADGLLARGVHVSAAFVAAQEQRGADADALYRAALDSDLRKTGEPFLRSDFHAATALEGSHVLQLVSALNIAQPAAHQATLGLHPQVLQLHLTDGALKVTAIEVAPVPQLSVALAPGTKLRLTDCPVRNGKLMVSGANCAVVGGRVDELYSSWKANKELKEKKRIAAADKADPPPTFTEFVVPKEAEGLKGKSKAKVERGVDAGKQKAPAKKQRKKGEQQRNEGKKATESDRSQDGKEIDKLTKKSESKQPKSTNKKENAGDGSEAHQQLTQRQLTAKAGKKTEASKNGANAAVSQAPDLQSQENTTGGSRSSQKNAKPNTQLDSQAPRPTTELKAKPKRKSDKDNSNPGGEGQVQAKSGKPKQQSKSDRTGGDGGKKQQKVKAGESEPGESAPKAQTEATKKGDSAAKNTSVTAEKKSAANDTRNSGSDSGKRLKKIRAPSFKPPAVESSASRLNAASREFVPSFLQQSPPLPPPAPSSVK